MRRDDILCGGEEIMIQRLFGQIVDVDGARASADEIGMIADQHLVETQAGRCFTPSSQTQKGRDQQQRDHPGKWRNAAHTIEHRANYTLEERRAQRRSGGSLQGARLIDGSERRSTVIQQVDQLGHGLLRAVARHPVELERFELVAIEHLI